MKSGAHMPSEELEKILRVYEIGFREIQEILDDQEMTRREQLDAISAIVNDDDTDTEEEEEE